MWVKSSTGSNGGLALVAGATTCDGMPEITKVVPSGSEWATAAEPTMPLAPGRFSTTTLCPNVLPRCSARIRPIVSALPPGGHGTTMRMGLLGQTCGDGGRRCLRQVLCNRGRDGGTDERRDDRERSQKALHVSLPKVRTT